MKEIKGIVEIEEENYLEMLDERIKQYKEIERLTNIINKTIECIDYWRNYDGDYSVEEEELLKILKGENNE